MNIIIAFFHVLFAVNNWHNNETKCSVVKNIELKFEAVHICQVGLIVCSNVVF